MSESGLTTSQGLKLPTIKPKNSEVNVAKNTPTQQSSPPTDCTVPEVIGGPPETGTGISQSNLLLRNSRLVLDVYPMKAKLQSGISLFTLEPDWGTYVGILSDCGIAPPKNSGNYVRIACQADSFPNDTFQNDYGDHFLSNIMDFGANGFTQLAQMGGSRKGGLDTVNNFGDIFKQLGASDPEGFLGKVATTAGNAAQGVAGWSKEKIAQMRSSNPTAASIANSMNLLLGGARIDFPMIWKNSTYNPTFSINVRLYNPHPAKELSTKNWIKAPLGALLALGLPVGVQEGDDAFGYSWPLFCKVVCKGVFEIKAGAIASISVSKGGDQGAVSFNQRLGIVDVRMDFINLHNVMIAMSTKIEERPTLKGYLNNIMDKENIIEIPKGDSGAIRLATTAASATQAAAGAMQSKIGSDTGAPAPPRAPAANAATAASLATATPPGFLPGT